MPVINVHERAFPVSPEALGRLLDSLGSDDDRLWPNERWPAIRFDGPLQPGSSGGHGPIRYTIETYEPGERIDFRFTAPEGFRGGHGYRIVPSGDGRVLLRHLLEMETLGRARLTWPLFFRPLHDALIEDSLDKAEVELTGRPSAYRRWSPYVRVLRWIARQVLVG